MTTLSQKSGFSLVEVTLALGITAFAMIAILGLLPVGLNSTNTASQQTVAVGMIEKIAEDLRQAPSTSSSSMVFNLDLDDDDAQTIFLSEGGKLETTSGKARYRAVVKLTPPGSATSRRATWGTIQISWPAPADVDNAFGSVKTFIAIDRN